MNTKQNTEIISLYSSDNANSLPQLDSLNLILRQALIFLCFSDVLLE